MSIKSIAVIIFCCLITYSGFAQDQSSLTLVGHKGAVNTVAYSIDGTRLFSGSQDNTIRSWDVKNNYAPLQTIEPGTSSITHISVSPGGKTFSASTYGNFYIFDTQSLKKKCARKKAHTTFLRVANYSGDGSKIVTSAWRDNTLICWQTDGLKKEKEFAETNWTDDAIFTPDGKAIISANHVNTAKVWDINTGNIIKTFAGHDDWVYNVRISKDMKYLYTGSLDKTIKIWDYEWGKLLQTLAGHTDGVTCIELSPDQQYLASGSLDHTIKIWDLKNNKLFLTLSGHSDTVLSLAYSPDGKFLASSGTDSTIKIWELNNLKQ